MNTSKGIHQESQELPAIVAEIAELIGFPATDKLIKQLGGLNFRLSSSARSIFPRLCAAIGQENAEKLATRFDGEKIYLPRCDKALRHQRNLSLIRDFHFEYIQNDLSANLAMSKTCARYGITGRQGFKILAKIRAQKTPH